VHRPRVSIIFAVEISPAPQNHLGHLGGRSQLRFPHAQLVYNMMQEVVNLHYVNFC